MLLFFSFKICAFTLNRVKQVLWKNLISFASKDFSKIMIIYACYTLLTNTVFKMK